MIYLASPFSHPDKDVEHRRFVYAKAATRALLAKGHHVLSPIAYCYQFRDELPDSSAAWRPFNFEMIDGCSELWVLMIDGWEQSAGVAEEIEYAKRRPSMVIKYIDWLTLEANA